MKSIDSEALSLLNRSLGLAGSGSQRTELEDGHVTQVLDIIPVARRGLTPPGTGGIFTALYSFSHGAGVTSESVTVDPYNIAAATAPNQWPTPVPQGMDVWLLGMAGNIFSGTAGNFTSAGSYLHGLWDEVAWSVDETGAYQGPGVVAPVYTLAYWDTQTNFDAAFSVLFNSTNLQSFYQLGRRIRRGETVQLISLAANAVGVQFNLMLGLFPEGFGQDALT